MNDMKKHHLDRKWFSKVSGNKDQLTVLQWNCLADWASDAFPRVAAEHLAWEYRKPLIIAEIMRADPDIVCLQEVDHFDDLKAILLPKYRGYFKSKGINASQPSRDGGAIFWKRDRFIPRGSADLHYSVMCDQPEMKQVMMSPQFDFKLSDGTTASVRIVATHLKAKKGFEEQRRLQCEAIAKFINLDKSPLDLTIICGDFNTDPDSEAVAALLEQTTSMKLESAYRTVSGSEPDWTTWKIRDAVKKTTIDFIFHDAGASWQPVDVWNIPQDGIDAEVALPCKMYPSDHLALAAKFECRAK